MIYTNLQQLFSFLFWKTINSDSHRNKKLLLANYKLICFIFYMRPYYSRFILLLYFSFQRLSLNNCLFFYLFINLVFIVNLLTHSTQNIAQIRNICCKLCKNTFRLKWLCKIHTLAVCICINLERDWDTRKKTKKRKGKGKEKKCRDWEIDR